MESVWYLGSSPQQAEKNWWLVEQTQRGNHPEIHGHKDHTATVGENTISKWSLTELIWYKADILLSWFDTRPISYWADLIQGWFLTELIWYKADLLLSWFDTRRISYWADLTQGWYLTELRWCLSLSTMSVEERKSSPRALMFRWRWVLSTKMVRWAPENNSNNRKRFTLGLVGTLNLGTMARVRVDNGRVLVSWDTKLAPWNNVCSYCPANAL